MSNHFFEAMGEHLGGLSAVRIEGRMFDLATSMVAGYGGGLWGAHYCGDVIVPELPAELGDLVRVTSQGNGADVETDRRSAAIALALLAINWRICELHARNAPDELMDPCIEVQETLRDVTRCGAFDAIAINALID